MEWYYAENNERRGPVADAEFNELIRNGRVNATTQVWRAGLESWVPLAQAGLQPANADGLSAPCVECHQTFPTAEMVQYEGVWICPNCKPVFFQKVKEGIEPTRAMDYAGFWIRLAAKFVDGVIVGVPGWVIQFAASAIFQSSEMAVVGMLAGWLISFALQCGYYTWLHGKYGATLGKMACGLRVVRSNGGEIDYGLAAGRFFAEILSAIIFYIGYIMAGFDDEKRTLHDRICNTRVIRSRA